MEESSQERRHPLRSFVEQHTWALLTLIPFIVVFLRVSAVSHFDLNTAQVIVRDVSPAQLVLGTLLPLVPTVAAAIGTLIVWLVVQHPPNNRLARAWLILLAIGLFTFLDWRILSGLLVVFGVVAVVCWRAQVQWLTFWRIAAVLVATIVLPAIAIVATLSDRPWLAAERITAASRGVVVGYVLSETLVWTTILRDQDREVIRVRNTDVNERVVCITDEDRTRSLLETVLSGERPTYPRCQPV